MFAALLLGTHLVGVEVQPIRSLNEVPKSAEDVDPTKKGGVNPAPVVKGPLPSPPPLKPVSGPNAPAPPANPNTSKPGRT